ncbi:MAG: Spy/CpxP family protein refolding chaperone [Leptolyngbyaceae cyanobacterium]
MVLRSALTLATTAILLSSGMAFAQPLESPTPVIAQLANPGWGRGSWLRDLNLTPVQVNQMNQIRDRYRDQLNQQRQALRQAQQRLQQLLSSSNASQRALLAQHRQVQALRQRLSDTQFESILAMREVLTPEQRAKLAQQLQQRRGSFTNQ